MTKNEAHKAIMEVVKVCRKLKIKERSFHLYYHDNEFKTVADSVRHKYGIGEHIKEYEL